MRRAGIDAADHADDLAHSSISADLLCSRRRYRPAARRAPRRAPRQRVEGEAGRIGAALGGREEAGAGAVGPDLDCSTAAAGGVAGDEAVFSPWSRYCRRAWRWSWSCGAVHAHHQHDMRGMRDVQHQRCATGARMAAISSASVAFTSSSVTPCRSGCGGSPRRCAPRPRRRDRRRSAFSRAPPAPRRPACAGEDGGDAVGELGGGARQAGPEAGEPAWRAVPRPAAAAPRRGEAARAGQLHGRGVAAARRAAAASRPGRPAPGSSTGGGGSAAARGGAAALPAGRAAAAGCPARAARGRAGLGGSDPRRRVQRSRRASGGLRQQRVGGRGGHAQAAISPGRAVPWARRSGAKCSVWPRSDVRRARLPHSDARREQAPAALAPASRSRARARGATAPDCGMRAAGVPGRSE